MLMRPANIGIRRSRGPKLDVAPQWLAHHNQPRPKVLEKLGLAELQTGRQDQPRRVGHQGAPSDPSTALPTEYNRSHLSFEPARGGGIGNGRRRRRFRVDTISDS